MPVYIILITIVLAFAGHEQKITEFAHAVRGPPGASGFPVGPERTFVDIKSCEKALPEYERPLPIQLPGLSVTVAAQCMVRK